MAVCYRHPDRETGVSCSNCGRPICPDCMTTTPVGMRCPECSREKQTVVRPASMAGGNPEVTIALIAINVLVYFGLAMQGGGSDLGRARYGLSSQLVEAGDWYRIVTSGFMHDGMIHILFNMYVLWFMGQMLEPLFGRAKFLAVYLAALLMGSFGALLLSSLEILGATPFDNTVGASGAVWGLLGAGLVVQYRRGMDLMQSGLLPLVLLNVALTFLFGFSVGGHFGGLVGGALAATAVELLPKFKQGRGLAPPLIACALIGLLAIAGSYAVI